MPPQARPCALDRASEQASEGCPTRHAEPNAPSRMGSLLERCVRYNKKKKQKEYNDYIIIILLTVYKKIMIYDDGDDNNINII